MRRNINIDYNKHQKRKKSHAQQPADVVNQPLSVGAVYALGLVRRYTSNAVRARVGEWFEKGYATGFMSGLE